MLHRRMKSKATRPLKAVSQPIYSMMGRILAIDYGTKRMGIAVTDPLQLIATPLTTISTDKVLEFLQAYVKQENIATMIVGMPKRLNNTASAMTAVVTKFIHKLQKAFPDQHIIPQDERYTSKIAVDSMIEGGFKKKDRRNKAHIDKLSATIILRSFLASNSML